MDEAIDLMKSYVNSTFEGIIEKDAADPPPADVEGPNSSGGSFDVSMLMGDSTWALPMLKGLVGPEKINPSFIDEILVQMDEEGIEVQDMFDPSTMAAMLRIALNNFCYYYCNTHFQFHIPKKCVLFPDPQQ